MSVGTNIRTEILVGRHRTQKSASGTIEGRRGASANPVSSPVDRVEISLTANMTVEAVNGVMQDLVVEQINKAIQEAGIDLTVEEAQLNEVDVSPEVIAEDIASFATGFFEGFRQNHLGESGVTQIQGFMTLIRDAIRDGFQQARDFLEDITTLGESISENIDRIYELTQDHLDGFEKEQLSALEDNDTGSPESVDENMEEMS